LIDNLRASNEVAVEKTQFPDGYDRGNSGWTLKCSDLKHSHEHFNFRAEICSMPSLNYVPNIFQGFLMALSHAMEDQAAAMQPHLIASFQ